MIHQVGLLNLSVAFKIKMIKIKIYINLVKFITAPLEIYLKIHRIKIKISFCFNVGKICLVINMIQRVIKMKLKLIKTIIKLNKHHFINNLF